jgi:hypothetical protein
LPFFAKSLPEKSAFKHFSTMLVPALSESGTSVE